VMFDGMSQSLGRKTDRLSVTLFADFTYDLGTLVRAGRTPGDMAEELPTAALLNPTEAQLEAAGATRAAFLAEAHSRFAQPLLGVAAALLGFATLLLGAFSRFGLWRQILVAIVLLIGVQMVNNAATGAALRDDRLWGLAYVAPVLGMAMGTALLALSQRPRRLRRAETGAAA
jgi:lipopolysaccharide export system permease protein